MCVSTWGSQGGMQNKSGIFVAFISKSQKPRDRLLFKEINLEKQIGIFILRRASILGGRAQLVGPVCKRNCAFLLDLKEMVLMYLQAWGSWQGSALALTGRLREPLWAWPTRLASVIRIVINYHLLGIIKDDQILTKTWKEEEGSPVMMEKQLPTILMG